MPPDVDQTARNSSLVDQLWERIGARLEPSFGRLETIVSYLFERPLSDSEVSEGLMIVNALSSKLATLGESSAATLIRSAATLLDRPAIGPSEAIGLAAILDDVRLVLDATVADRRIVTQDGPHVLVIGISVVEADEMMWVAIAQGMNVTHYQSSLRPVDAFDGAECAPEAVLVVLADPDLSNSQPLLRAIGLAYRGIPVVAMTPPNSLGQRASGVGQITTIMSLDTPPEKVMNELRLAAVRNKQSREIVVLGKGSDWVAAELNDNGLAARIERSAGAAFEAISAGGARAIIIVQDASTLTAVELTALLRSDISTRDAIIVVVADSTVLRHELFSAGADAVFGGRADIEDLIVLVRTKLNRPDSSALLSQSELPPHTLPWLSAVVLIERLLMGSMLKGTPVGLAVLEIPADRDGNLAESIAGEFRTRDVVGRHDGQHLVAALDGVSRQTMVSRMGKLVDHFGLGSFGTRVACLEFPLDGRSVDDLVAAGLETLDRARRADGPAVVGADWRPDRESPADVLIVDPDMILSAVLGATIERRGLRVEHQPDSLEALNYLTGNSKRPLPRLVLLEFEQQGVGGLQFLRQIKDSGNLGLKVIMLSSRAVEADMREAFELGVTDYVSKPFSTPLVLQRIQRALDD